jgi:O-Antigen ligase
LSAVAASAPAGAANPKEPTPKFVVGLLAGGLLVGGLAGYLGSSGSFTHVLALGVVLLPVALWKRPYIAPAVLLGAGVLVEQSAQIPHIPITDRIPLFQGIGPGHLEGADILLLMVLFIYLSKGRGWGTRLIARTHVSLAVRAVLGCVVLAVFVGQAHHGDLRTGLMQSRPWVYLGATYFLTSAFIRDRRAIRAALWTFVGTVGFKALQAIYVWISGHNLVPTPPAYISHEASYFFVIFAFLVAALWLLDQRGRLRTWATWLLPVVLFATVVNNRREAWEMLGGGLLCFSIIAYKAMPIRRGVLGKAIVALVLCSAVYFPVMWNSTRSVASPARAIKSQINPTYSQASSDTYRVQENDNLELNIKQSAPFGKGYGVKIDYALPIYDISDGDQVIAWVPHNQVLDVLMAMGFLGGVAVWFLIGAGIISGSRLAMAQDREVAVIGLVVACALVAYAFFGARDVGFFDYRIAFITGTLLGLAEAARRLMNEPASMTSSLGDNGARSLPALRITGARLGRTWRWSA